MARHYSYTGGGRRFVFGQAHMATAINLAASEGPSPPSLPWCPTLEWMIIQTVWSYANTMHYIMQSLLSEDLGDFRAVMTAHGGDRKSLSISNG